MNIQVGSKVRSFDFEYRDITGEDACYIEGEVVDIRWHEGCDRYVVIIEKQVFSGKEGDSHIGELVFPPVNGIKKMLGGITDGVELL